MSTRKITGEIKMKNYYYKKVVTSVLISGLTASVLFAGAIKSQGSAGAAQLLIPSGSKNLALGNANVSLATGVSAMHVNPSGTSGMSSGGQVLVSDMTYIADIGVSYAGLVSKLGNLGTVGFAVKSLDFGDIPVTTATETEGTGATYSPSFLTMTANYSRAYADNVRFGVNLKFISETIMSTSANGVAGDLGVQYDFNELPLSVGVALKNLGGRMTYSGSDMEQTMPPAGSQSGSLVERFRVQGQSFELPAQLDIGINYKPINGLEVLAAFTNNSASTNVTSFGAKFSMSNFWLGGGMSMNSVIGDQGDYTSSQWGDMTDSPFGASFGAGVSFPVGELNLDLSYSMRTVSNYFDNNSLIEMAVNF